jgi:hypothetical protein
MKDKNVESFKERVKNLKKEYAKNSNRLQYMYAIKKVAHSILPPVKDEFSDLPYIGYY